MMSNGGFYNQNYPPNQKQYNSYQSSALFNSLGHNPSTSNQPLPLIPQEIGKSFSNQLKQLQLIEKQLSNYNKKNLPELNTLGIDEENEEEVNKVLQECNSKKKLHEQNTDENLKEKFEAIKEIKSVSNGLISNNNNKSTQQEEYVINKTFKNNMNESFANICNSIKAELNVEKNKSLHLMEDIKKSIIEMKTGLVSQINSYGLMSNEYLKNIKKVMLKGKGTRLRYLTKNFFPSGEIDKEIDEEEKREEDEKRKQHQLRRMSILFDQNNAVLLEARKQNEAELNIKLHEISNYSSNSNSDFNQSSQNDSGLDFRILYKREDNKLLKGVTTLILQYANSYKEMLPINKFRAYVYFIIAAKRILNIQYIIYSRIKFDAVHFFLDNYEDMDIIIKKLMYNSMKSALLNILNDSNLDINIAIKKPNAHDLFLILKQVFEKIIEGLSQFFQGVSKSMLSYLSLFLSNYSYIPGDFFSTFELLRFKTTKTGEFIEMEKEQQRMILGFYLIIKILLKNIFLELCFNQKNYNILKRKIKLNIKMIVTIIYRGIIDEFKKCQTQRNVAEIEDEEDEDNYSKISYPKRDFNFNMKVIRKRIKIRKLNLNDNSNQDPINKKDIRKRSKNNKRTAKNDSENENDDRNNTNEKKREKIHTKKEPSVPPKKKRRKKANSIAIAMGTGNNEIQITNKQIKGKPMKLMPLNFDLEKEKEDEFQKENSIIEHHPKQSNHQKDTFTERVKGVNKRINTLNQSQAPRIPPKNENFPPLLPGNSYSAIKLKPPRNSDIQERKSKKRKEEENGNLNEYYSKSNKLKKERKEGHIKSKSMGYHQLLDISKGKQNNLSMIQNNHPPDYYSEFSKEERTMMSYIMNNFQSFGEDSDPNEFELIDRIVYQKEFLQTYDLFKEEYQFDPIKPFMSFIDKLLEMIISNFNKE